jgi:HrpA-like RNA helicase
MESSKTSSTRILFCTTGILLRMLQEGGQDEDGGLAGVSHVIVDEAHERDVLSDFLLIILRDLVRRQRHLRVVIMSATMEAQRFADYLALTLDSSHTQSAPIIQVPGRTFPVVDYYLEDILEATGHVISEGHPCALRRRYCPA